MGHFTFFTGRTDFETEEGIKRFITNSKRFSADAEDPTTAEALLIFQTSKQQTWLVSTSERLYCILDDRRKDQPHINWHIPKQQLVTGQEVSIELAARDRSAQSGLVDIGRKHRNWLYTKQLFSRTSIEAQITEMIRTKMR